MQVTHTALVTPQVLEGVLGPSPTVFNHLIKDLLIFFGDTYRTVFKFEHPPLHDPCAVAFVIAPQLFETQAMRVDIETSSPLSAGQTVCDVWGQSKRPKNCNVAVRMDVARFWDLLLDAVHKANQVSPLNRRSSPSGSPSDTPGNSYTIRAEQMLRVQSYDYLNYSSSDFPVPYQ